MTEYQIQPNTRRCAATGRELQPGERYFTALIEDGAAFVRQDFASEAWKGPPHAVFSFWTGRIPQPDEAAKPRFDDDLLEECFHRLEHETEPSKVNFRYVVALLLIRRKRLRFEQSIEQAGVETLEVSDVRTGDKALVTNPQLSAEQMAEVQAEVFRVLGWN